MCPFIFCDQKDRPSDLSGSDRPALHEGRRVAGTSIRPALLDDFNIFDLRYLDDVVVDLLQRNLGASQRIASRGSRSKRAPARRQGGGCFGSGNAKTAIPLLSELPNRRPATKNTVPKCLENLRGVTPPTVYPPMEMTTRKICTVSFDVQNQMGLFLQYVPKHASM